ncbi:MAG: CopD family protein [Pseudomonadota bacterium]|nr:CopD family protein [Pseudomonadota bacterium]
MMVLLKFVHVGAIAVWAGGLIVLPLLLAQRKAPLAGDALHELHRLARQLYVVWMSPAAALAIASGTALILARQTYVPWFTLKMGLIGFMAMLHVMQGLLLPRVFAGKVQVRHWLGGALAALHVAVVVAVLAVVLAKPLWPAEAGSAPGWLQPGQLGEQWGGWVDPWLARARQWLGTGAP